MGNTAVLLANSRGLAFASAHNHARKLGQLRQWSLLVNPRNEAAHKLTFLWPPDGRQLLAPSSDDHSHR